MRQSYLSPEDTDYLGRGLLALTRELWVMRDRLHILEAVLEKHGLNVTDEIDTFMPDDELKEKLATSRQDLLNTLTQALNPAPGSEPSPGGRVKTGVDKDAILHSD